MASLPQFNPLRLRSYIFRLPLCTRVLLSAIVALWIATIPFAWLKEWGSLEPDKVNFGTSMCMFLFVSQNICRRKSWDGSLFDTRTAANRKPSCICGGAGLGRKL
jgi:hypothetical protein